MAQPKWGGSVEEFETFATRAAQNADAFPLNAREVIHVFYEAKRWADAKPILQATLKNDPNNVSAMSELGQVLHYNDRNYPPAEALYRRALKIEPDDARTLNALADIEFFVHSNVKAAVGLRQRVLKLNPNDQKARDFIRTHTGK